MHVRSTSIVILLVIAASITTAELISIASTNTHLNPAEWIGLTVVLSALTLGALLTASLLNQSMQRLFSSVPKIHRAFEALYTFVISFVIVWMIGFTVLPTFGRTVISLPNQGITFEFITLTILSFILGVIAAFFQDKSAPVRLAFSYIQPCIWAVLLFIAMYEFSRHSKEIYIHMAMIPIFFFMIGRHFLHTFHRHIVTTGISLGLTAIISLPWLPNNTAHALAERARLWFHGQHLTAKMRSFTMEELDCAERSSAQFPNSSLPTVRGVVIILIDMLRADRIEMAYKNDELTPNLNAFARNNLYFRNAFTLYPSTVISLASMGSGSYNTDEKFKKDGSLLSNSLFEHSYRFDALPIHHNSIKNLGEHITVVPPNNPNFNYRFDLTSPMVTSTALEHLGKLQDEKGFLFLVHNFDFHAYYVKNELVTYGRLLEARYNAEVKYTDHYIGKLLAEIPDDIAVLILSDHGEELGDHGYYHHGNRIYDESSRIVAMLKYPGVEPAIRTEPISSVDVAPTIFALLGIEQPSNIDGIPFTTAPADRVFSKETSATASSTNATKSSGTTAPAPSNSTTASPIPSNPETSPTSSPETSPPATNSSPPFLL